MSDNGKKTESEAIDEICGVLDTLLMGQTATEEIDLESYPEHLTELAGKVAKLGNDMSEQANFVRGLVKGALDSEPPPRSNYIASPLKELHSQLNSLSCSIAQLSTGKVVGRMYFPGELFENYNDLISKIARNMGDLTLEHPESDAPVSSWRYHQLLLALNNLRIMIIELDVDGALVYLNPPAKEAFPGIVRLDIETESEDEPELLSYLRSLSANSHDKLPPKGEALYHEIYEPERDQWYKVTTVRINLADGSDGILHMVDDISEWKASEKELKRDASLDPLTTAYTRRVGYQRLQEMINARHEEHNCAALIDIDKLKYINDTYGHVEGDYAIKAVAEVLMTSVRENDWVIRIGGDEFIVLFGKCRDAQASEAIARMKKKLSENSAKANKPYTISFSSGIANIDDSIEQISDLVAVLDERMYEEKVIAHANMP